MFHWLLKKTRNRSGQDKTASGMRMANPWLKHGWKQDKARSITIQSNNNAKQQHATHENSDRM